MSIRQRARFSLPTKLRPSSGIVRRSKKWPKNPRKEVYMTTAILPEKAHENPEPNLGDDVYRKMLQAVRNVPTKRGTTINLLDAKDHTFYLSCAVIFICASLVVWFSTLTSVPIIAAFCSILFGICSGWIGFQAHDAGHGQAPKGKRVRGYLSRFVLGNLMLGFSWSWWVQKHTTHHTYSNIIGKDGDTMFPILAFTPDQAREKSKDPLTQFLLRHEWWLFFLYLPWQAMNARRSSVMHLFNERPKDTIPQAAGIIVHFALYGWLLFTIRSNAGWEGAALFFVLHQFTHGVYNSMVFAPNHKGMPTFKANDNPSFLAIQILTSRDVKGPWFIPEVVTDWMMGKLNQQVAHHVFPKMPSGNLRRARPIIASICWEYGIPYTRTGITRSYIEVVNNFKWVSRELVNSPMGP